MTVKVLGIDTGWCATGLALIEWDEGRCSLVAHKTIYTEPTAKKRRMLVVDDHLRRIRELRAELSAWMCCSHVPHVVAMEAFSQARNAAAAARQAFGYATAVVCCDMSELPVIQFTPTEVRKRLGVPKPTPLPKLPAGATKEEKRAHARLRQAEAQKRKVDAWTHALTDLHGWHQDVCSEHESDAACAAMAALRPVPVDLVMAVQAGRNG